MKKYVVTVKTEELKGRYEKTETFDAPNHREAVYIAACKRADIYRACTVFDEWNDDDEVILEHFPRMRTTLTISEA